MDYINKQRVSTGTIWEGIVGYSRAVRVGNQIAVTGTIALDEKGNLVGENDPAAQTRRIIQIAEKALKELGASLKDVYTTRIYVTDIHRWEEIGRVHGEYFGEIRPATTMVEVSRLVIPEAMVEIEFSAMLA
jgi:enamine deaminase RidA (YjgF/YER057c/UK114 family)